MTRKADQSHREAPGRGARAQREQERNQVPSAFRQRRGPRSYEDWTKQDLYERARELGIQHRSKMTKSELIRALRHR